MFEVMFDTYSFETDLVWMPVEIIVEHKGYILSDLSDGKEHTLAEMYHGDRYDIPLYLALHYLIVEKRIVGIDPYSSESPQNHRFMSYRLAKEE